jgi:hypothetical protein
MRDVPATEDGRPPVVRPVNWEGGQLVPRSEAKWDPDRRVACSLTRL